MMSTAGTSRKVLGLGCGQAHGSAEILLKAALKAAEGEGAEVELVRLDELRLPSGTAEAAEPDDAWWLWGRLVECDGLIVSTPIISRTVAARLKLLVDRLLGPNADAAIIDGLLALRRQGREPGVPFRVDERVRKPRVAGFLAVGGSLTSQWKTLTLPIMHTTTFSMHIAVVDQVQFGGAGAPRSIVLDAGAIDRAALLGRNVAGQLGVAFDQARYLGPPGLCPVCHLDVVALRGADVECATCGAAGRLGPDLRVTWTDLTTSVISMDEKRAHAAEIQDTAARHHQVSAEIDARALTFEAYDRTVRPERHAPVGLADRNFPPGFLWGVAGAGHQTEGGNTGSDTWFAEHVTPTVFAEPSDRACDSWTRWREDIGLACDMGLTAYRFSVEWARVEPEEGVFSGDALGHYEAIVDECLARGLAPVVTFSHFTCPHWFAKRGGFLDQEAPRLFARYCDQVMQRFGDRIAYAVTLNEPNLARLLTWFNLPGSVRQLDRATLRAASEAVGVPAYRLTNVVLPEDLDAMAAGLAAGHLAAKAVIKARRPGLAVGLSLAVMDDVVVGDDPSVRDRKRAECYRTWLELAREDDFVGVQNYERVPFDAHGMMPPPEGAPVNQMGTAVEPLSLAGAVRYAHAVAGVPVLVTEHGVGTADDAIRSGFIEPALRGLLDVIEEGVPVLGYIHWALLDNFEWIFGYAIRYGLYEVDRTTFERTAKPSAAVYAAIAKAHGATRS